MLPQGAKSLTYHLWPVKLITAGGKLHRDTLQSLSAWFLMDVNVQVFSWIYIFLNAQLFHSRDSKNLYLCWGHLWFAAVIRDILGEQPFRISWLHLVWGTCVTLVVRPTLNISTSLRKTSYANVKYCGIKFIGSTDFKQIYIMWALSSIKYE